MKIDRNEVLGYKEYGAKRDHINSEVVSLEHERRITTKTFSFLFEHKDIVLNQIHEMVYLEEINDEKEIQNLIDIYSEQLPQRGTMSVTMFIEFPDEQTMVGSMKRLAGVESSVYLTFDGNSIRGTPEEGRSTDVLESTLQYIKFHFGSEDIKNFINSKNAYIETKHDDYSEAGRIEDRLLNTLKQELIAD